MDDANDNRTGTELVALVVAGQREAFAPLLLRNYGSLLRLCERLLGSTSEAQDVVQEAALQAFLGLRQLHDPERFGPWLHAIAANLARMALRRRRTLSLDALGDGRGQAVLWTAGQPTPEEVAAAREAHDAIVAALSELSSLNREVAIGFYLEGYSYAELAALLGVPISTVKGRLFFGRRQLRQRLRPLADELWGTRSEQQERRMTDETAVPVTIDSVRVDPAATHSLVALRQAGGERVLPIWIRQFEAEAIRTALEGQQPQRPMTHDLTLRLLEPLGGAVQQVTINTLVEQTYYAEVTLAAGERVYRIDARPSDALALAVRAAAPMFVTRQVMEQAGMRSDDLIGRLEGERRRAIIAAAQGETAEQVERLLELREDLAVVARASSAEELLEQALSHRPQLVVLADDPPQLDGVAATERLLAQDPAVRVVLLARAGADPDLGRAMQAGARGVLARPFSAEELYATLRDA